MPLLQFIYIFIYITFYWMYRPTCMSLSFYSAARQQAK